jgi:hypothetical protein
MVLTPPSLVGPEPRPAVGQRTWSPAYLPFPIILDKPKRGEGAIQDPDAAVVSQFEIVADLNASGGIQVEEA